MSKERLLFRCPVCAKVSPPAAFKAGVRGEDTHALLAKVVAFIGGGREGRPKVQAMDEHGRPKFDAFGQPVMVLLRDEVGKALPGRGFDWSSRDLTPDERVEMVQVVRAVANRLTAELIHDVLMNAGVAAIEEYSQAFQQEAADEYTERVQLLEAVTRKRYSEE